MTKISITIVLVVKNEISFIEEMLQSIIYTAPNFLDLNILIIDDHSSDQTFEFCTKFLRSFAKSTVIKNPGIGKVQATLASIKFVKTEWVKFVDGDDCVNLSQLTYQMFDCDAFYHDYVCFDEEKERLVKTSLQLSKNPNQWVFYLRSIPKAMFFCKIAKLNIHDIDKFKNLMFEDLLINVLIALNAKNIKKQNVVVYKYRQHDDNFYGEGFRKNPNKVILLGKRLNNFIETFSKIYPEVPLHHSLKSYCKFLQFGDFLSLLSLFRSPYLFMKGIYFKYVLQI